MTRLSVVIIAMSLALCARSVDAGTGHFPVTFDKSGIPIINMVLGGTEERVYVDSGSAGFHVPESLASRIDGLMRAGTPARSIDLAGKERRDERVFIPRLEVNGLIFTSLKGQILSSWGVGSPQFTLPVIGLDFLLQKEAVIDFPKGMIDLGDPGNSAIPFPPPTVVFPFDRQAEGLIVPVHIAGQKLSFVLDTGATLSMVKATVDVPASATAPCPSDILNGKCQMVENATTVAGVPLARVIRMAMPNAFRPDGILGNDYLRRCAIHIDAARGLFETACPSPPS